MKRYINAESEASNKSRSRDSFSKFYDIIDEYLPDRGEGDTMATQIVTAVNKLIYKWFNDGDVFDNTGYLEGWANDLSSYANWLYDNVEPTQNILIKIHKCTSESAYTDLLYNLASATLISEDLAEYNTKPAQGSIYDADGPFEFVDEYDEDEDEY